MATRRHSRLPALFLDGFQFRQRFQILGTPGGALGSNRCKQLCDESAWQAAPRNRSWPPRPGFTACSPQLFGEARQSHRLAKALFDGEPQVLTKERSVDVLFTRGILIDIPRLKGVPYLEPGTPIYVADLEAWEKKAGVKVSAGDALFVRTGVWARRKAEGPWLRGRAEGGRSAGLDPSVIPWLKQRDIAILGSDHPQYVSPSNLKGAVHDFALLYLGVHLFDNCDLEALGDAAAARKRWEFLLTAAPLAIRGGTGSPINPVATF